MEKSTNDKRIMTMQIVWVAMLISCGMFAAMTTVLLPAPQPVDGAPNTTLQTLAPIMGLLGLAAGLFIGHMMKVGTHEKAVVRFIIACALCESAATWGLIVFVLGLFPEQPTHYYLIGGAFVAIATLFPTASRLALVPKNP
jgi:hypothetical protein